MKQSSTSSEDHRDSSQIAQVKHPKRGAIPSPLADIEKAPTFAPNQGTEAEEQTSSASEMNALHREG